MNFDHRPLLLALALGLRAAPLSAQQPGAPASSFAATTGAISATTDAGGATTGAVSGATRVLQGGQERIEAGRALLDANDARSVAALRDASQSALAALLQVVGPGVLSAAPGTLPGDFVTAGLARNAAQAHLLWGIAADRFARRDESITALARAVRLSRAAAGAGEAGLQRDASQELSRVLRDGLPLVAPDDALDSIAAIAHGGLWKPRRVTFDPAPISGALEGAPLPPREFLVTDGSLFPPVDPRNGQLSRVPALYTDVPDAGLPPSLRLNKMVAGYERETSGPNRGQWRQVARVFYASPYLTKNRRDDLPRARALCEEFLRVHSLFQEQLGATNLYARGDKLEGVTTLWLLEISALWPQDDDDPAVLAQLGPLMPPVNVGSLRNTEPRTTALMRPWMPIAGQVESVPGEILFWKAGLSRPESEWTREIAHEYGHVALPPLGGFLPPLEPYANGLMGETLGALWAAQAPERFGATAANEFAAQVGTQALPALAFFLQSGPGSSLRASGEAPGLKYLQGLTVYIERVYGARMLGRALAPLSSRAAQVSNLAARRSLLGTSDLMASLDASARVAWGSSKTIPVWLPGALKGLGSAANLIARGDALLRAGSRTSALLYVPPGADSLRIEGEGAEKLRAIGLPFQASAGGMRVYFSGRSGWQTFSLVATNDVRISAARFERK